VNATSFHRSRTVTGSHLLSAIVHIVKCSLSLKQCCPLSDCEWLSAGDCWGQASSRRWSARDCCEGSRRISASDCYFHFWTLPCRESALLSSMSLHDKISLQRSELITLNTPVVRHLHPSSPGRNTLHHPHHHIHHYRIHQGHSLQLN
jgi:hypothetical protein